MKNKIISQTLKFGACLAGTASADAVKASPTFALYQDDAYYGTSRRSAKWFEGTHAVLVFGFEHPLIDPRLDWWDSRPGGTPGNRKLIAIQNAMGVWLETVLEIESQPLPYRVERGGVFLKDAAVLAGLGVIGANNLLLHPAYGPRLRLRALLLDASLEPDIPLDFDPCSRCPHPCWDACPQNAFREGRYERKFCLVQMSLDEADPCPAPGNTSEFLVDYCRACELACPVGKIILE
jgi:epoxyqueuosine reductase